MGMDNYNGCFQVKSRLPNTVLAKIWKLSDVDRDGMLDDDEFALASHLIALRLDGESTKLNRKHGAGSDRGPEYRAEIHSAGQHGAGSDRGPEYRAEIHSSGHLHFVSFRLGQLKVFLRWSEGHKQIAFGYLLGVITVPVRAVCVYSCE